MSTSNVIRSKFSCFAIKGSLLFIFILNAALLFAQETIVVSNQELPLSIGNKISILTDNKNLYDSNSILLQRDFFKSNKSVPIFNSPKNNIWVRFTIVNRNNNNLFVTINYADISSIKLYEKDANNRLRLTNQTGNTHPFYEREDNNMNYNLYLSLANNETKTFYLNINSSHPYELPIFINNQKSIAASNFREHVIIGLYCGILISTILYNLFLLFATRDKNYLFYVIYLFALCFAQITFEGWSFRFFWPALPQINSYIVIFTSCFVGIMGIVFAKFFLSTAHYTPKINKILSALIVCYAAALVLSFSKYSWISYSVFNYIGIVASILLLYSSILIYKKGFTSALFYLIAWSAFLSGFIIYLLKNLDIIPFTDFTHFIVYIGSSIEVVLLSFALANKINILQKEKEASQADALRVSKENEMLIQEQNTLLEKQVAQRTYDLEKTLRELKDAQIQLVESEKMASLGQLTAGIAHEINNPINFVKSNVSPLQMDVQDLFELITEYQKLHANNPEEQYDLLQHIKTLENRLDPDFLKEEIQNLISGIEEGAERTAEIVRGLRNFSRLDESEMKEVSIYENINSTLILLRNIMPHYLKIRKHFDARGEIECYPGKLNQVFMNILTNCIQAIKTKPEKKEEEYIDIRVEEVDDCMRISISDTGIGMNDEVKHKIFDPFFTTKDVGEGTGLGMAIVFKIIEKHHGKIYVHSSPGEGAMFAIEIPYMLKSVSEMAEQ